ncbi:DUF6712 family protein [Siphonobacter sp. SORGH_AS_1065]|uniref:DUF6712 family protein n=1 Tax=Siphonobacter sp. SORGH_AS_1065 TaxID=3041795 RepID=UPI00278A91BD|nr:DUF6712 family protein [Siphonobacter sp. SORGH_AS_1065]MDQ1088994.1 hypothetical protein [Siphonobacter sp. SORGH_AS_1065]
MLINDQDTLKEYLGGIQKVMDFATWKPFVRSSEQKYIIPAIGWDQYRQLVALDNPNQYQTEFLDLIKAALAWFTYVEAFPHLTVGVGDAGISVQTPTNSQAMAKWQYVALTKESASKADENLEGAIQYLETFANEFPAWKNSTAYSVNRGRLISSATEATRAFPAIRYSRRLFLCLRDYFQIAEKEFVRPILGPLYEELIEKLKDGFGFSLTIHEAEVLDLSRKAIAQYGFAQAVPYLNMNVDFRLVSETDGILNEDALGITRLNAISQKAMGEAQEKAAELKRYLNENASADQLASYYSSSLYMPPAGRFIKRPKNDPKNPYFVL